MYRYLPFHASYVDLDDDGFISPTECNAVRTSSPPGIRKGLADAGDGCVLADTDGDSLISLNEYNDCCGIPQRNLMWFEQKTAQQPVPPPHKVDAPLLAQVAATKAAAAKKVIDEFLTRSAL